MGMNYDEKIFQKYRALAITDENKFVEGKTYYSNYAGEFIFVKISTDNTINAKAIISQNGDNLFCKDNNIGASYNPWLIFDNKETCEACNNELITDDYDDYDDYDYVDVYDYADDFDEDEEEEYEI